METRELARFVANTHPEDVPESVQDEAARTIVDWLGCALGGCMDPAIDIAVDTFAARVGAAQATLMGRGDRFDVLSAALVAGAGSHVLDFDATHAPTRLHAAAPILAALMPLAELRAAHGAALVHAFTLGVEVACRAARALGGCTRESARNPTAACGPLGAASACARLLALDADQTVHAIGIAATQAAGITATLGTPSQCLDAGFAARNGLTAALLAERGFSAAEAGLEGRRGLLAVLGVEPDRSALTRRLGETWELGHIAHKAYPGDTLLHAVVDACLQLREEHGLRPRRIAGVGVHVHPLVLSTCGVREPRDSAQAGRSLYHVAAAALFDGAVGLRQFRDERVRQARLAELRGRVDALGDAALAPGEARVEIALHDGGRCERHVRRALGSPERPLGDAALSDKFRALAGEVLATDQAERLLALAWNIRALGDVGALVRASVPEEEVEPQDLPGSPLLPR